MIITVGQIVPFTHRSKWIKELSNEMMILSSLYFVMCFSPLVSDSHAQDIVGYGFCGVIGAHCLVNIAIMFGDSLKTSIANLKKYLFIHKHMQKRDLKRDWFHMKRNRKVARHFFKRREATIIDEDVINEY